MILNFYGRNNMSREQRLHIFLALLLFIFLIFIGTQCYANVSADDLPVNAPLAKIGNSFQVSTLPIVLRIIIILSCILIVATRGGSSWMSLAAIVVAGTVAVKSTDIMSYLGW